MSPIPQALSYKKNKRVVLQTPKHYSVIFRGVTHNSPETF